MLRGPYQPGDSTIERGNRFVLQRRPADSLDQKRSRLAIVRPHVPWRPLQWKGSG
jgi:hypothetical protein